MDMTLEELVELIDTLDDAHVVCARPPWHGGSDAQVVALEPGRRIPQAVTEAGFQYFLQVDVIREVLAVFANRPVTRAVTLKSLVYYAVHDTLPDWLYSEDVPGGHRPTTAPEPRAADPAPQEVEDASTVNRR
jgi:hypothetical protein